MGRAGVLQEIRRMRFEALLERHERGELSQLEAAEMLGMSERTFRRWRDRLRDEGPEGLIDGRIGKPSSRRASEDEILRMLGLYRDHYADFTVKHFHEQLVKRHGYKLGYTVTKLHLHRSGLVRPAPRRSAHRKKRPRRPMAGMLLHQDASRHDWLDGAPPLDLVVTLDDATSEIYSAFLVAEEGTASSFRGLAEVVAVHGDSIPACPEGHLVMGHFHPAWSIEDAAGARRRLPVFVVTPKLTVLPAFSPYAGGYNLRIRPWPAELAELLANTRPRLFATTGARVVELRRSRPKPTNSDPAE